MLQRRSSRPAIERELFRLLIGAEREPRLHPGLAVELVVVEAEGGEALLHLLELRSAQLHHRLPRRLERPRVRDAVGEMADEQHIEVGKIVFLDDKVVVEDQEARAMRAGWQQQRGRLGEIARRRLAAIRERETALEPFR